MVLSWELQEPPWFGGHTRFVQSHLSGTPVEKGDGNVSGLTVGMTKLRSPSHLQSRDCEPTR